MKTRKIILSIILALLLTVGTTSAVYATTAAPTDSDKKEEKKAPYYDISINIVPEKGWLVNNSTVNIKVIDNRNTGTFQIAKVEAKIGADGKYEDITDTMRLEVSEKCSVYVTVTDIYGNVYSQTRYIDGYDTTPPTFNVAVNNGVMVIETNDNESGVEAIYINGYRYKPNKSGKLTVRLQKFDASYANFSIYVVDASGNESEAYVIDNPYYKQSKDNDDNSDDTTNPADSLPTSGEATDKGESSAEILTVTDENGNDISNDVNTKQFYNIVTKDGQTFYLVIDMSGGLQQGDNDYAGASSGTVYFLTYISNNDLLNVTSSDEVTLGYNSVAGQNNIDEDAQSENTETTESTEEKEEEEPESEGTSPIIFIIVIIVIAGVVFVTLKSNSSGKNKTPGDFESEEDEEDEEELIIDSTNYEGSSPLSDLNENEEDI